MESFRETVEQILEDHNIAISDAEDIFEAVSDILEASATRTERLEPHATDSIRKYREVASDLSNFNYFVDELADTIMQSEEESEES